MLTNLRSKGFRSWAAVAAAALSMMVVGLIVGTLASADTSFSPATEGDPQYLVTNVALNHTKDGTAIVSFDTAWDGGIFPGHATCRITVVDATGGVLATRNFEYASFVTPDSTEMDLPSEQQIGGTPNVECSAGVRPGEDAGYVLSDPRVVPGEKWEPPHLQFQTEWKTDEPPLYQECSASLRLPDGNTQDYAFGISLGRGEQADVLLTEALRGAQPLSVVCATFEGRQP